MRWAALLRGVNVGRGNRVAMADLRAVVAGAGYTEVGTVLASGNLVLTTKTRLKPESLAIRLEELLGASLKLKARVTAIEAGAFAQVLAERPRAFAAADGSRLLVGFPRAAGALAKLAPLASRAWTPAALAVTPHAAWLWCPNGVLADALFDEVNKLVRDDLTTRNWNTVLKLHTALGSEP